MRRISVVLLAAALAPGGAAFSGAESPPGPVPRGGAAPASGTSYWARRGCSYGHPSRVAYRAERALLRSYRPLTRRVMRRSSHYAVCVATRGKSRAVWRYVRSLRRWRSSYGPYWEIRLAALPAWARGWAWSTSGCESDHGRNPRTNLNGYRGRFQWVMSTWWGAGGTGDPAAASYAHEAVIAIRLMFREGAGHWPNCG